MKNQEILTRLKIILKSLELANNDGIINDTIFIQGSQDTLFENIDDLISKI